MAFLRFLATRFANFVARNSIRRHIFAGALSDTIAVRTAAAAAAGLWPGLPAVAEQNPQRLRRRSFLNPLPFESKPRTVPGSAYTILSPTAKRALCAAVAGRVF
jgi:hypothetical protein